MTAPSKFAPTPIWWVHSADADETPMPNRGAGLTGLLRLTSAVAAAGAALPEAFITLRDRVTGFCAEAAGGSPLLFDRLGEALLTGRGDPWVWYAASVALTGVGVPEARAETLTRVHAVAEGALRTLYQPLAGPTYAALASKWDTTAAAFHRAAAVVDPTSSADAALNSGDRAVTAWRHAAVLAGQLDDQLEGLAAAAELCRGLDQPSGTGTTRDAFLIPLVADTQGCHPREVLHAWRDWPAPTPPSNRGLTIAAMTGPAPDRPIGTRTGKWGRLIAIGATLRAYDDPAQMPLLGAMPPIGVKPVFHPELNRETLERFDPCGPLPVEAPRRRRLRDMFRRTPDQAEPEPALEDTFMDSEDR